MRVIAVHGTHAGASSDSGEKWWQLGSRFQCVLEKNLEPTNVVFEPYRWEEGPNSEEGRREAGKKLYARLVHLERAKEEYSLIGHSHGGSVIYGALLHSAVAGIQLQGLKSWVTVGTPFLTFDRDRRFLARLNAVELAALVWSIGYAVIPAALLFVFFRSPDWQAASEGFRQFVTAFIAPIYALTLALGVLGLWYLDRCRSGFGSPKSRRLVADWYGSRWRGFWHQNDEAVAALSLAANYSTQLVRRDFLVPGFALLGAVLSLTVIATAAAIIVHSPAVPRFFTRLDQAFLSALDVLSPLGAVTVFSLLAAVFLIFVALCVLGAWLGAMAYVEVAKLLGLLFGVPASSWLNSRIWRLIRTSTWGADVIGEHVAAVAPHPPLFSDAKNCLSAETALELVKSCDRYASEVAVRFRQALGATEAMRTPQDIFAQVMGSMDWRGLIHTSYFEVDAAVAEIIRALSLEDGAQAS